MAGTFKALLNKAVNTALCLAVLSKSPPDVYLILEYASAWAPLTWWTPGVVISGELVPSIEFILEIYWLIYCISSSLIVKSMPPKESIILGREAKSTATKSVIFKPKFVFKVLIAKLAPP